MEGYRKCSTPPQIPTYAYFIGFYVSQSAEGETAVIQTLHTFSSLFCQLSSLFTMRSMQWDRVARIPAVVALNVMASPLKSMPLIPLGLTEWNTEQKRTL